MAPQPPLRKDEPWSQPNSKRAWLKESPLERLLSAS